MFDITKIDPIIIHLKSLSSYYKESGNEIILFCPYCDDAQRLRANHGHLYVAKTAPVFNCFRCSVSGNLVRLLIDTGFDDEDILKHVGSFIRYKAIKDYHIINKKFTKLKEIIDQKIQLNLMFKTKYPEKFEVYHNYIYDRLGIDDFADFLISPIFFNNKLSCMFSNAENEDVLLRLIESYKDFRYHLVNKSSGKYFFQEKDFEKYTKVVLAEGPFDILNLYLYNSEFKDCWFLALNGKKYISAIEQLILEDWIIGHGEFNLIFDADVSNFRTYLNRARLLAKQYNDDIVIRGFIPLVGKDTGDYPVVIEV